jgi:hypothetical protein
MAGPSFRVQHRALYVKAGATDIICGNEHYHSTGNAGGEGNDDDLPTMPFDHSNRRGFLHEFALGPPSHSREVRELPQHLRRFRAHGHARSRVLPNLRRLQLERTRPRTNETTKEIDDDDLSRMQAALFQLGERPPAEALPGDGMLSLVSRGTHCAGLASLSR